MRGWDGIDWRPLFISFLIFREILWGITFFFLLFFLWIISSRGGFEAELPAGIDGLMEIMKYFMRPKILFEIFEMDNQNFLRSFRVMGEPDYNII